MRLKLFFALLSVFLAVNGFGKDQAVFDQQTFSAVTNLVQSVAVLNESLMWLLKIGLWIMGGVCALICANCFFSRS